MPSHAAELHTPPPDRATVGTVIPDFNVGYTYQKTDPRILRFFGTT